MRQLILILTSLLFWTSSHSFVFAESPNELTDDERKAGFELLFDGKSFDNWKHAGNWKIENGVLARKAGGGSLVYTARKIPDDFELRFEWKVAKGSNSGVYYRPGQYEYQILDNSGHSNGTNPRTCAASLYFCVPPSHDATRPIGEWNAGRIVCKGTVIQHWLNGKKVVHLDYTDERWKDEVEMLRLRGGDVAARGANLSLQDHGDPVWFRSIKLRELDDKASIDSTEVTPEEVSLEAQEAEKAKLRGIIERRNEAKKQ